MNTGSQGGSFAGNMFSIAISDGHNPVIIGMTDASTVATGGQSTGFRQVSGVVPNSDLGRAVREVILSLELGPAQDTLSFSVDDVQLGD